MYLKSLEMFGFKSFADKTRIDFMDGTTSLLGPNGCGKSNIVDAIKWVLGEQSTKTLRAGKMDDVIFNGTDTRKPMNVAEVALVINNENHSLPVDDTEVEIRRRIYRGGNSEYFLNRVQVRRSDIKELFMDTGVGKTSYSILEQGKIDQILSSKPEDRRYIFEEAAGITKNKADGIEASRKLEKMEENLQQVEVLFSEVKRTYELRKTQASKVLAYKDLEREQTSLEVDIQLSTVKSYQMLKESRTGKLEQDQQRYEAMKASIENFDQELDGKQHEMREYADERIRLSQNIQNAEESLGTLERTENFYGERFRDLCKERDDAARKAEQSFEQIQHDRALVEEKRASIEEMKDRIASYQATVDTTKENLDQAQALITKQDAEISQKEVENVQLVNRQEALTEDLKNLTDVIVGELDKKLKASGYTTKGRQNAEKEFSEKLNLLISLMKEKIDFLDKLVKSGAFTAESLISEEVKLLVSLQKSLEELKLLFVIYGKSIPSFIDEFLSPEGIITKKHKLDKDMQDCRVRLNKNRERITELREENRKLDFQKIEYQNRISELKDAIHDQTSAIEVTKTDINNLEYNIREREYQHKDLIASQNAAEAKMDETREGWKKAKDDLTRTREQIASDKENLSEVITVINTLEAALNDRQRRKQELYDQYHDLHLANELLAQKIEQVDELIAKVYEEFHENYGKSLREYEHRFEEELNDIPALKQRLEQVKKEIRAMGHINYMAESEFAEIKERYDFMNKQLEDLNKAKNDVQQVIEEIRTRSEALFMESFTIINANFQEMFKRVFGGGNARLDLADPENVLESGIDILAQPPGKKLTHLPLLSGGERSMTAVALLFATYMVKPSPFCVLDEIDAALDDRNIGFFLGVLEDFSRNSQFIIITHNKHTVMGSQSLLGVTQQEAGVSIMVSYKKVDERTDKVIFDYTTALENIRE